MMSKILREPLLHFLMIGGFVFALFQWTNDPVPRAQDAKKITISSFEAERLVEQFQATWRRAPTKDELQAALEGLAREEVLQREALSLSLDQNDAVIRSRLSQKMQFLAESAAGAVEPTEADLRAFYEDVKTDYTSEPMSAFVQVFLGSAPTDAMVADTFAALNAGADPATLGASRLLPQTFNLATAGVIDRAFGGGFAAALSDLEPGSWQGPIRSGYGLHAILMRQQVPASIPAFDTIRDTLSDRWTREQVETRTAAILREIEAAYTVVLPSEDELEALTQ